jgi:hypothetical protein
VASSGNARRTGHGSDGPTAEYGPAAAGVIGFRSRVTQPEHEPAGQQRGRGPGGQHA